MSTEEMRQLKKNRNYERMFEQLPQSLLEPSPSLKITLLRGQKDAVAQGKKDDSLESHLLPKDKGMISTHTFITNISTFSF